MENQELIAKYKRQLQNPNIDDEVKSSIRKKLEALEGESQPKGTSEKKEDKKEEKKQEESGESSSKKERIEELKKILDSNAPEIAKKRWREELQKLQGKEKPKPKPKPKPAPKPTPKPKVSRKPIKDKPEKPKVDKVAKKVVEKPIAKEKPKVTPKVVVKKKPTPKKVYEPKVKTLAGEPDCDTLLKQFRARRRKSKEAQKKRKTTPIFRKISVDVVDAVEKAIKNVPAQQIKESPKETIRKFGVLKKLASDFLNAFKDVLGKEFDKSEAKKELDELTILIDKLNKKYTSKK